MKYIKFTALLLLFIWGAGFIALKISKIQDKLVFNPSASLDTFINNYTPSFEKHTALSTLWLSRGEAEKPAIILSHGRSAHDFTLLPLIDTLRANGNSVILYSYRGYTPGTGAPSEQNAYADLEAAVNFAKTNFNITEDEIILAGHSLGAAVVIDAASKNNYKAVIAMVPFSSVRDVQKYQAKEKALLYILSFYPMAHPFNSVAKVSKISSPFYLFYSNDDTIAPPFMSEKLLKNNPEIKAYVYPHGEHRDATWFAKDLAALIKTINN